MTDLAPSSAASRLPERYQRRAIEIADRVRAIGAMIAPAPKEVIAEAVIRMARQFRPQQDEDQSELFKEFKASCLDLPEWAISEATNDYLAGRVPNHEGRFMPTCAEFAKRAREIILPFLAERSSLRVEAEKLVERWQDEERRNRIAIERADPAVKARAEALMAQARVGQPKVLPERQPISSENQSRLDAMKKHRPFVSKIGHEPGKAAGE